MLGRGGSQDEPVGKEKNRNGAGTVYALGVERDGKIFVEAHNAAVRC